MFSSIYFDQNFVYENNFLRFPVFDGVGIRAQIIYWALSLNQEHE